MSVKKIKKFYSLGRRNCCFTQEQNLLIKLSRIFATCVFVRQGQPFEKPLDMGFG